jgi:hypothetical protein
VRTLENEIARFKDWDAEKQRYELAQIAPKVFAYSLKQTYRMENHHI